MRVYRKVPDRLPAGPALIRSCAGCYDIWTGRGWFGSVERRRFDQWTVTTPATAPETFLCFASARDLAESLARRAEG